MRDLSCLSQNSNKPKWRDSTVGFFIGGISYAYHYQILSGVKHAFSEHNINTICYLGGTLNSKQLFDEMSNIIYQYVSPEIIDGLLISGSINIFNQEQQFYDCYRSIPMVLIAMELDGLPAIKIQNDTGFRNLLRHLIRDHGYRRLAYIGGPEHNPDARQRYRIYCEILAEHEIPFDFDLVTTGQFHLLKSGSEAVRIYLDERKVTFDVIVAANDVLAMGAVLELLDRGIRVPEQIAVTGFDDQDWAKHFISPLTTVSLSIYDLGKFGAELMSKLLEGKCIPQEVYLDTELVIRSSCGCFSNSIVTISQSSSGPEKNEVHNEEMAVADGLI